METYPPPEPNPRKPRISVPPGACDTLIHIFGPVDMYPLKPTRIYEPHIVGLAEMRRTHDAIGIERAVLVTPTVYGTDNRCMVASVREGKGRYRGVAVIDDETTDAELEAMHEAGVRGARCNFVKFLKMTPDPELVRRTCKRIAPLGWHVVLHVEAEDLLEYETLFRAVEINAVIDHMAHLDLTQDLGRRALTLICELLQQRNWWIKLSNGDRNSEQGPPYADTIPLGQALAEAAPERALWGTDWPHVLYKKPKMVNDGDLIDLLADYVPDEAARNAILVDNPQALYGFA